ncbi:MAG: protein kinase [Gemmatimonadota bacterium]|nr:protein kinase [Gemmatimonadota bacterium]
MPAADPVTSRAASLCHTDATSDDLLRRLVAALGTRYVVERELGAGGMGRVFGARDTDSGRQVAIKVLAPAVAACCDIDRFRREMNVVSTLRHPHIVPLLEKRDACEGDGLVYFVMRYVHGETLHSLAIRPLHSLLHIWRRLPRP